MGRLNVNMVKVLIMVVIITVIVFTVLNETAGDVGSAAGNLTADANSSGTCLAASDTGGCQANITYPLMSFFGKKGVLLLAMISGVIILLVVAYLSGFGGRGK